MTKAEIDELRAMANRFEWAIEESDGCANILHEWLDRKEAEFTKSPSLTKHQVFLLNGILGEYFVGLPVERYNQHKDDHAAIAEFVSELITSCYSNSHDKASTSPVQRVQDNDATVEGGE